MLPRYDLVVIGTGSAGSTAAAACRAEGWSVAVVDRQPYGGTCPNRGCDPKKVLVGVAMAFDQAAAFRGHGIVAGGIRMAWSDLVAFKRTFTDPVPASREESFAERGIDCFHGVARFTGPTTLDIAGTAVEAGHIVVASGATPASLPGADHMLASDGFMELDTLPDTIVFVGGGYISMEFAHLAARAGAGVTVLHRGSRILDGFDPDLAAALVERSRLAGIDVELESEVAGVSPNPSGGFDVSVKRHGEARTITAALVVHGAGRVPDVDALDLAAGHVERTKRGVTVSSRLQSVSNPQVYAAGDCADTGAPPLTPVAGYEGGIVAANLLGGSEAHDAGAVPSVAFTIPPIARVGLLEAEARQQGLVVDIKLQRTEGWYSSKRLREPVSACKTIVDQQTGRILGAHLLGPHADEVINVFALAIQQGLTVKDLRNVRWAYPTNGSDLGYML